MIAAFLRRNWRTFTVAFLGALIAFSGSFLLDETYAASTKILIRGRDVSFLTSTGQDLTDQPGVIDATLSQSLASTYAGMATSRTVAVAVVDQLHLDAPKKAKSGPIGLLARGVVWTYRCGRAFVSHGFCAPLNPREKAITDVQQGIQAAPHGATAGQSAGEPGSYVLDLVATGTSPRQAQQVTDAVADQLVALSSRQFSDDAQAYVATLTKQVTQANSDVAAKNNALAAFKTANHVSAADEQQVLSTTAYQGTQNDLAKAKADLADAQGQLASLQRSLASTPPTVNSSQHVDTGRSSTTLEGTDANPSYSDLVSKKADTLAAIDGLQSRIAVLTEQLSHGVSTNLNAVQAKLAVLTQDLTLATNNQTTLTTSLQKARSNALSNNVALSRLDRANLPTYPIAPKRYLYLALGLLIGGLAGGGLTWLSRRRRPDASDDLDDLVTPTPDEAPVPLDTILAGRTPVADPARNGHAPALSSTASDDDD